MLTFACVYMMIKTNDGSYGLGAFVAIILETSALIGIIKAFK